MDYGLWQIAYGYAYALWLMAYMSFFYGLILMDWGLGFKACDLWLRYQVLGLRAYDLWFDMYD